MTTIRLLLVDDEPRGRAGLRVCLGLEPDIRVVGETGDGVEAMSLARALRPDVVLMDVDLPGLDGLTAAARLRAEGGCDGSVVILSLHDDSANRERASRAGCAAFVGK